MLRAKYRWLLGLVGATVVIAVTTATALTLRTAPYCDPGQNPEFVLGLAFMKSQMGDVMGEPLECEHPNPDNGDTLQQTSTGLAYYRKSTNIVTFTDGWEHWGWTAEGLVHWTGSAIDPPDDKPPSTPPTPTPTPTQNSSPSGTETSSTPGSIPIADLEQSIKINTGSIWSIPVYDGSNLIVSTEAIGSRSTAGIYMSKFDISLNLLGPATHIIGPQGLNSNASLIYTDANNINSIADHKHIFQNDHHYITFSISGATNLYLMKIDTDLKVQGIVEVTTNNPPTNDMFMVGDGNDIHVGKFHPGQGHDIYSFDADLNFMGAAIPIGNTGSRNAANQHSNGAAAIFHNNQFHLVAPESLAPGQGDWFSRIIFDSNWNIVDERSVILTDSTMLGIVSGLSHEPVTDTFIVHYTRGDTDGGGSVYQAIYSSAWDLLENEVAVSGTYQRPHSVFVDNDLFVGYDSAGTYLSKFNVTYP